MTNLDLCQDYRLFGTIDEGEIKHKLTPKDLSYILTSTDMVTTNQPKTRG
jgi:hypothetical protein